ncbi:Fungal lipase-like domain [Dillenia turbinata]|uniref:Fungal lipase-like domain n=1 Tax=Dillenia turbinata TaxID=194707 RepID=A0AAN8URG7_9MAGN
MKLSIKPNSLHHHPHCTLQPVPKNITCIQPQRIKFKTTTPLRKTETSWEGLLNPAKYKNQPGLARHVTSSQPMRLGKKWMEYQGIKNWDGLLEPLDDHLRGEILRYGEFVQAAYKSFDFDPASPSYATCRYPKSALLDQCGLEGRGYRITKNLRATSSIQLPRWTDMAPSWTVTKSSWIGYVAICQDKQEIARLGRRDIVIAYRGTATCMEWLENLRATLTHISSKDTDLADLDVPGPMVETGFLSLYTSGSSTGPSLQEMVREEISRLLKSYGDEPLSLTITGHSLGAALAILTAYDIRTNFKCAPLVTVISFGGPRVGNRAFRAQLEKQGTKVLRIVNADDVVTKMPGFILDDHTDHDHNTAAINCFDGSDNRFSGLSKWVQNRVLDAQLVYAEVGEELRLSSSSSHIESPSFNPVMNMAARHELSTYLDLVNGFVSSRCPIRATAKRVLNNARHHQHKPYKI